MRAGLPDLPNLGSSLKLRTASMRAGLSGCASLTYNFYKTASMRARSVKSAKPPQNLINPYHLHHPHSVPMHHDRTSCGASHSFNLALRVGLLCTSDGTAILLHCTAANARALVLLYELIRRGAGPLQVSALRCRFFQVGGVDGPPVCSGALV